MLFHNNNFVSSESKGFSKEELEDIKSQLSNFELEKTKESDIKEYIQSKINLERFHLIAEYLNEIEVLFDLHFEEGKINKLPVLFSNILSELNRIERIIETFSLNLRNVRGSLKNRKYAEKLMEDVKKSAEVCGNLVNFVISNEILGKPDYSDKNLRFIETSRIKNTPFILNKLPKELEIWEPITTLHSIAGKLSKDVKVIGSHEKIDIFDLMNIITAYKQSYDVPIDLIRDYIYLLYLVGVFQLNNKKIITDVYQESEIKSGLKDLFIDHFKKFLSDIILDLSKRLKNDNIFSLKEVNNLLKDISEVEASAFVSETLYNVYDKIEFFHQEKFEEPECVKNYDSKVRVLKDIIREIQDWVLEYEFSLKPYEEVASSVKKTIYVVEEEIARKEEEFEIYIGSINEEKIRVEGKSVIDKHITRINEMLDFYQQEISRTLSEEFPELKSIQNLLKQYKMETVEIKEEVAKTFSNIKDKGISPYSFIKDWEEVFSDKTTQIKFAISLSISKLFKSFKDIVGEEEGLFEMVKNIQLIEDELPLDFRFSLLLPEKLTDENLKERIQAIRAQISLLDKLRELYSVELNKFESYLVDKIKFRDKITSETCVVCHKKLNFSIDKFIKCPFCESVMHYLCIAWWLESHGTCPVCNNNYLDPSSNLFEE